MAKRKKSKKKKVSTGRPVISEGDFSAATDGLVGNRVFFAMAKTINIGNYESVRVECGRGKSVPDGEQFDTLFAACKKEVVTDLLEMVNVVEKQFKR